MFGKKRLDAEIAQQEKIKLYKRVFSTEDGKAVLVDILDRNYVIQSTGGDQIKEGRRVAALDIMFLVQIDLRQFLELTEGK